jgi:hypothetical protein
MLQGKRLHSVSDPTRLEIIRRAQVWSPTPVARMDFRTGPAGPGAFPPDAVVPCDYAGASETGHSPKFNCEIAGSDKVKVKYGRDNGEVYAEVAATRLFWALGFAADREYPVRIVCRRCPANLHGQPSGRGTFEFPVAIIERKVAGREIALRDRVGWTWPELDLVDEKAGGAPRSQLDALKLLAVLVQHTDSKSEQQRLICVGEEHGKEKETDGCARPVAMVNDLGLTFGRANEYNRNAVGSVNLAQWSRTPVWTADSGCVGNITRSSTGTLDHPRISEDGRRFLAELLLQLSDTQLVDLFASAHFESRTAASDGHSAAPDVSEWVAAFKTKREAIASRRCDN